MLTLQGHSWKLESRTFVSSGCSVLSTQSLVSLLLLLSVFLALRAPAPGCRSLTCSGLQELHPSAYCSSAGTGCPGACRGVTLRRCPERQSLFGDSDGHGSAPLLAPHDCGLILTTAPRYRGLDTPNEPQSAPNDTRRTQNYVKMHYRDSAKTDKLQKCNWRRIVQTSIVRLTHYLPFKTAKTAPAKKSDCADLWGSNCLKPTREHS